MKQSLTVKFKETSLYKKKKIFNVYKVLQI